MPKSPEGGFSPEEVLADDEKKKKISITNFEKLCDAWEQGEVVATYGGGMLPNETSVHEDKAGKKIVFDVYLMRTLLKEMPLLNDLHKAGHDFDITQSGLGEHLSTLLQSSGQDYNKFKEEITKILHEDQYRMELRDKFIFSRKLHELVSRMSGAVTKMSLEKLSTAADELKEAIRIFEERDKKNK